MDCGNESTLLAATISYEANSPSDTWKEAGSTSACCSSHWAGTPVTLKDRSRLS